MIGAKLFGDYIMKRQGIAAATLTVSMGLVSFVLPQAACATDANYVDQLPDVSRVLSDYKADTAFETRVRQWAACDALWKAVDLQIGTRSYNLGEEVERRTEYVSCVQDRDPDMSEPAAVRRQLTDAKNRYNADPQFAPSVLRRYLNDSGYRQYTQLTAMREDRRQADATAAAAPALAKQREAERVSKVWFYLTWPVALAGAALAAVGLLGLGGSMRPYVLDRSAKPMRLATNGRRYQIYSEGAVVIKAKRSRHTETGADTRVVDQHGALKDYIVGYSATTTSDSLFVIKEDGKERSLNLTNWDVDFREGHRIGYVWALEDGKDNGPMLLLSNYTLDQVSMSDNRLAQIVRPSGTQAVLTAVGILIGAPALGGMAVGMPGLLARLGVGIAAVSIAVASVKSVTVRRVASLKAELQPLLHVLKISAEKAAASVDDSPR